MHYTRNTQEVTGLLWGRDVSLMKKYI